MYAIFTEQPSEEDLEHFGVKGMKWGVRKKSVTPTVDTRTRTQKQNDYMTYGKHFDKKYQKSLSKGMTVKKARGKATRSSVARAVGKGLVASVVVKSLVRKTTGQYSIFRMTVNTGKAFVNASHMRTFKKAGQAAKGAEFLAKTGMALPKVAKTIINEKPLYNIR